jgi:hypothetical protein
VIEALDLGSRSLHEDSGNDGGLEHFLCRMQQICFARMVRCGHGGFDVDRYLPFIDGINGYVLYLRPSLRTEKGIFSRRKVVTSSCT